MGVEIEVPYDSLDDLCNREGISGWTEGERRDDVQTAEEMRLQKLVDCLQRQTQMDRMKLHRLEEV